MEEKEVRNEVPAPETDRKKEEKTKKELTPQQIQQRKKMLVYPLMGLVFLGSMYLIFAPSDKDEAKVESVGGFNADIPQPKGDGIISDKKTAYEQEQMENNQAAKMRSLQDFAFSLGEENGEDLTLIDDAPAEKPKNDVIDFGAGAPNNKRSSIQSSAAAYRDMTRQLGSFYETPKEDKEKEELKRQVEELTARLDAKENGAGSMDEQVALMEKSYELAARNNGKQTPSVTPTDARKDRTSVKPVKRIRQEVVSSLAQPVSDGDFIAGTSEERNTGFHTPVGRTPVSDRNTIAACVHGTQTVSDGQALRVRLLEAMAVDDRLIPKGTVLTGRTRIQGERMDVVITNVEYQGTVIPVELEVYDADGQQGILVPNSLEYDAVREIAAGMGGSMGSSISISTDAGAQIASDLGKGVIQGVSQYITKKMRTVKVTLKAGHRLLLHSPEQ